MLTFEDAIVFVRKEFPDWLISTVYEFDNNYYFSASPGKDFIIGDLASLTIVVNRENGSIETKSAGEMAYDFVMKMDDETYKRYDKASSNIKPVDLTKEQFEALVRNLP